jgi:hypothetical protein
VLIGISGFIVRKRGPAGGVQYAWGYKQLSMNPRRSPQRILRDGKIVVWEAAFNVARADEAGGVAEMLR